MREELRKLLDDFDESYDTFQLERLVVGRAGGTHYGMYKQALRELNGRIESLKQMYLELEEINVDMTENVKKRSNPKTDSYESERCVIRVKKCLLRKDTLDRKMDRAIKEINRLYDMAMALKKWVGEITPEKRKHFETELHSYHIKLAMALELFVQGRLSYGSVESLYAMTTEQRIELMDFMRQPETIKEFIKEGGHVIPRISGDASLTEIQMKELIQ
jgi:ribosomal protein S18